MEIFIGILVIAVIVFLVIPYFRGSPRFWRLVGRVPNEAYELFKEDPNWIIMDGTNELGKEELKEWVGPFRLAVPKLNKVIKFYGRESAMKESEESIEKKLRSILGR